MKSAPNSSNAFIEADAGNAAFFIPFGEALAIRCSISPAYIRLRLENAGVLIIDDLCIDTYSDEHFYSYRRSIHRKETGLRPPCSCHRAGTVIATLLG